MRNHRPHQRALLRCIDAEHQGYAEHAFRTDHSDLETGLMIERGDQRDETFDGEIHMIDAIAAFAQHIRFDQVDFVALGDQSLLICARQGGEQVVHDNGSRSGPR